MNETTGSVRHWYVSGRFQKVALAIIVGGCLFGIGFQHYVRGPRQQMGAIHSAVLNRRWNDLLKCFDDGFWSEFAWSRATTEEFMRAYIEPKVGPNIVVQQGNATGYGRPYRFIAAHSTNQFDPILVIEQSQTTVELFRTSTSKFFLPTGWRARFPSPVLLIRDVATAWYPHPEISDLDSAERVAEYEFLISERVRIKKMGGELFAKTTVFGTRWSIDSYVSNLRRILPNLKRYFDEVDSKRSGTAGSIPK